MATVYGKPNNRTQELVLGSEEDDDLYPLGGWDIVQGMGGFDTVFIHGLTANFRVQTVEGVTNVDALSGASAGVESALLYDVERIEFLDSVVDLTEPRAFVARDGNEVFVGNAGLDSATFGGPRSQFNIEKVGSQYFVTDLVGAGGVDRLQGVERLVFGDAKVALDLSGAARDAARLVGTLLGPEWVTGPASSPQMVGAVLGLFDQGQTLAQVAQLAVDLLGWDARTLIEHLYPHALGRPGTEAEIVAVHDAVAGMSVADIAVLACELGLVDTRIDLVGLAGTGLTYL